MAVAEVGIVKGCEGRCQTEIPSSIIRNILLYLLKKYK